VRLPNLPIVTGMPFCILARNYACLLLRLFCKNVIVPKSLAGTFRFVAVLPQVFCSLFSFL